MRTTQASALPPSPLAALVAKLMSGRGGTSCKSAAAIGERPRRVLIQAAIISFA